MAKLTTKQQRFVDEYLIDMNGTQAARRAGYSAKSAAVQASKMLKVPKVSAAIAAGQKQIVKRIEISQERVALELGRIAFADPRRLIQDDGTLKPLDELDDDTAATISTIEHVSDKDGAQITRVKGWDKVGALEKLANT